MCIGEELVFNFSFFIDKNSLIEIFQQYPVLDLCFKDTIGFY